MVIIFFTCWDMQQTESFVPGRVHWSREMAACEIHSSQKRPLSSLQKMASRLTTGSNVEATIHTFCIYGNFLA